MFTDTHCHIDFKEFDSDRNTILAQCQSDNIHRIIVPGVKASNWQELLNLCQNNPMLFPALGLHPFFISEHKQDDLQLLKNYCKKNQPIAIGEIGLDYQIIKQSNLSSDQQEAFKKKQLFYFNSQLQIAKYFHLPVLVHARKSHQDIIQNIKTFSPLRGIIHAFNGSEDQAKQYIELGFMLGFGGAFTNPKASHLQDLVKKLPLNSMVLETDAPDMLPFIARKKHVNRNTPENIIMIFKEFSSLRNEDAKHIEQQLEKNIQLLFKQN